MSLTFTILGATSSIGLQFLPDREEIGDVSLWTGISALGAALAFLVIRSGHVTAGVLGMTFISLAQHVLISQNPHATLAVPYFASIFVLIAATTLERRWLWPVFGGAALCLLGEWRMAVDLGFGRAQINGTFFPAAVLLSTSAVASWLHGTSMDKAVQFGLRYEEERAVLHERVAASARMETLGRLAGAVAHDFNNLLVVMRGSAELAKGYLGQDHPAREELDQIEEASVRAGSLSLQLLTYSRRQAVEKAPTDVGALLHGLTPLLRRLVGPSIVYEPILPPGEFAVFGSATQLEQVILNLVANARDASSASGSIEVELASCTVDHRQVPDLPAGKYVEVQVRDFGVGMTPEVLQKVFEPFFTTKGDRGGTGLGLATSLALVNEMGGTILIASAPQAGSTFRILMPEFRAPGRPDLIGRDDSPA